VEKDYRIAVEDAEDNVPGLCALKTSTPTRLPPAEKYRKRVES